VTAGEWLDVGWQIDMRYSVGIDITARSIHIVQIAHRRSGFSALRTYTKDVEGGEFLDDAGKIGEILTEARRSGNLVTKADIVMGLPSEKVFFGNLRTDVARPEDVRRLLKFELEDDFPVPCDDLVMDICGHYLSEDGGREYLIAAVHRGQIDLYKQGLEQARWQCSVLSADICALETVARMAQLDENAGPSTVLHVDGYRAILGILRDRTVLCARHLVCEGNAEALTMPLAREIERTFRGLLGRQYRQPLRILISGRDELARELAEKLPGATGHDVQLLDLASYVRPAAGSELDGRFAVALGFALMGRSSGGHAVNFLNADLSQVDRVAKTKAKRAAVLSGVLLLVILGLLGLHTFRELKLLEARHDRIREETRTVFLRAVPDEKRIVSELAQMTEHLNLLRRRHGLLYSAVGSRIEPLAILHVLSERMGSEEDIAISRLAINDQALHITGTGSSFESVEQFVDELRRIPQFSAVRLEDVGRSREGDRREFRLVISMKKG
jgi:hypothetical protein